MDFKKTQLAENTQPLSYRGLMPSQSENVLPPIQSRNVSQGETGQALTARKQSNAQTKLNPFAMSRNDRHHVDILKQEFTKKQIPLKLEPLIDPPLHEGSAFPDPSAYEAVQFNKSNEPVLSKVTSQPVMDTAALQRCLNAEGEVLDFEKYREEDRYERPQNNITPLKGTKKGGERKLNELRKSSPNLTKMLKNRPTKTLIFPTSGTFGKDSTIFRTTKQRMEAPTQEAEPIDRMHHRKAYFEK